MVKKYIILAKSNDKTFDIPRQLIEINGEPLVVRTIRLLKENGVNDIIITSDDKRFDNLGAERYDGKYNNFDYIKRTGYWLDAFPFELMNEPVCFIWGDVYFSENAIKTIVQNDTNDYLFFCTYNNKDKRYIKEHDEPLAFKVKDTDLFKKHINIVKEMKDKGLCCREPIIWEVYRSMNGQEINEHVMTTHYIAINDISCDIDSEKDVDLLNKVIGGDKMIRCEVIKEFTLEKFNELKNIVRHNPNRNETGKLYEKDTFECTKEMGEYLTGNNDIKKTVVKIIEVIPEDVKVVENVSKNEQDADIQLKEVKKPKKKKSSKK